MRNFFLCFIISGQMILADDVTLWISSADDNSVGVSMIADEEIYGFQMMFSVEEGPENIFAPIQALDGAGQLPGEPTAPATARE